MLEIFLIVIEQITVLFFLMLTGYLLGKLKWIDDEASGQISRLLLQVALPCVIIRSLQVPFTRQLFRR